MQKLESEPSLEFKALHPAYQNIRKKRAAAKTFYLHGKREKQVFLLLMHVCAALEQPAG